MLFYHDVEEAKDRLLKLLEDFKTGEQTTAMVMENNEPVAVVLSWNEYASLLELLDRLMPQGGLEEGGSVGKKLPGSSLEIDPLMLD